MSDPIGGEVVCGAEAASCKCVLAPHATDVPHECNPAVCTGSWIGNYETGEGFVIVRIPTPAGAVNCDGW